MSAFDNGVASLLPIIPRFIVGRVARQYIAGETIEDGIERIRTNYDTFGDDATLDILGEFVRNPSQAREAVQHYERAILLLAQGHTQGGRKVSEITTVSLKATGICINPSKELTPALEQIVSYAEQFGVGVTLDMENSPYTSLTLAAAQEMWLRGHRNFGACVQAMLDRTENDVAELFAPDAEYPIARKDIRVRIVKGIYRESADIASRDREEIRKRYRQRVRQLLNAGVYVEIATHDLPLIYDALNVVRERGIPASRYEFQSLLGVNNVHKAEPEIVEMGAKRRVYIPVGKDGYGYSVRRLRENPEIAGHVVKSLLFGNMLNSKRVPLSERRPLRA